MEIGSDEAVADHSIVCSPAPVSTALWQAMGLCRKPQLVVKFCSGQLGIPLGPPSAPGDSHRGRKLWE